MLAPASVNTHRRQNKSEDILDGGNPPGPLSRQNKFRLGGLNSMKQGTPRQSDQIGTKWMLNVSGCHTIHMQSHRSIDLVKTG